MAFENVHEAWIAGCWASPPNGVRRRSWRVEEAIEQDAKRALNPGLKKPFVRRFHARWCLQTADVLKPNSRA